MPIWLVSFTQNFHGSVIKHFILATISVTIILIPLRDLDTIIKNVIFSLSLQTGIFRSLYDNVIRWMPQDLTDDKSTLGQAMAWCHQAASHYLGQCWPSYMSSYGVTRPQWVKGTAHLKLYFHLAIFSSGMKIFKISFHDVVDNSWKVPVAPFSATNFSHITLF